MALHQNGMLKVAASVLAMAALAACGDDTTGTGGAGGGAGGETAASNSSSGAGPGPSSTSVSASNGTGGDPGSGGNPGTGGETGTGGDPGSGGAGGASLGTIYEVASSLPDYSSLVAAVDKAGLAGALQDEDATLTVFAPDNDAFAALLLEVGAASLDDVTAEQLVPILLYHVLGSVVDSAGATAAAEAGDKVTGLGGGIQFGFEGADIELDNRAIIEAADVPASNGIIHGISGVILPSIVDVATSNADFSSLVTALSVADSDASDPELIAALDDDGGTFTVFAPTNDAFDGLVNALSTGNTGIAALGDFAPYQLIPVLKYHVVAGAAVAAADVVAGPITTLGGTVQATLAGGGVQIDGVSVVVANLITSNGIVHVIDDVLVPSIVDVASNAPELSSLLAAVLAADGAAGTSPKVSVALDASAGVGAFTIFAPSNAAFTTLGNGAPAGQALTNVLLYHVVNGAAPIYAGDALELATPTALDTLLGSTAPFEIVVSASGSPPDTVNIDDAGSAANTTVIGANYFTSNGVLHIIDKVLLPGG